jgi:hypothetical protein
MPTLMLCQAGKSLRLGMISLVLIGTAFLLTKSNFQDQTSQIITYTCLIMLSLTTFFVEHYFTKPTDVFAAATSSLLLIAPLYPTLQPSLFSWFTLYTIYLIILIAISICSLLLFTPNEQDSSLKNKISNILKSIAVAIGSGRLIFFFLLIITLTFYARINDVSFFLIASIAAILVFINPRSSYLKLKREIENNHAIGEIIGVQSGNIFVSKLYTTRDPIYRFDHVEFKYSMDQEDAIYRGVIIDNYLLNEQQWVKILLLSKCNACDISETRKNNILHKISREEYADFNDKFAGIIIEGSNINKIRFEYSGMIPVYEGELVEITLKDEKRVLYQIVQGATAVENLDPKNEAGFIVGEAVQLGVWDTNKRCFDKHGWVPNINTPVMLASKISTPQIEDNEIVIGNIPNTNYPVIINVEDAVSHHLAILGVTGAGKSVFARNLIKETISKGIKVICVDFTNEYGTKLGPLVNGQLLSVKERQVVFSEIDKLSNELEKFANQQNKPLINQCESIITAAFEKTISEFLTSNSNLCLFELPDVSNSTGIFEYTRYFFKTLFNIAKNNNNYGERVCVVLEEAHTVVPEWNFSGVSDKRAQGLVNCISQIALQGRKYNVGFYIIAQRTANVSKTILTQCNSIIAFKQFDKTGRDFLANHIGDSLVSALPDLKFRQAIAVGKAILSGVPLIFEVPRLE